MQHRIGIRQFCFLTAGVPDAGDDKRTVQQWFHISDPLAVYCLIAYLYRYGTHGQLLQMAQPVLGILLFFLGVNPHEELQGKQRQDAAHYTQRIGNGISECDFRSIHPVEVTVCLLGSTQTGGIGHGSGQDTHHRSNGNSGGKVQHNGDNHAEEDGQHCYHVQRKSALLESGEESRSHLQTDGIDKQYQAELLQEVQQMFVEVHVEMSEDNAHKQNPGDTQRDTRHLQLAQHDTEGDDQGQNQDRVCHSSAPKVGITLKEVS